MGDFSILDDDSIGYTAEMQLLWNNPALAPMYRLELVHQALAGSFQVYRSIFKQGKQESKDTP